MPRSKITTLYVYMNNKYVGDFSRASSGEVSFVYNAQWLSREDALPVSLSMPLTEVPFKGAVVYNFFDNLLPDSKLIRSRIQTRFNTPTSQCFDVLSSIGADCVGALQLLTQKVHGKPTSISAEKIADKAVAQLLKNYRTAPLGMDKDSDFRISISGAQEKTGLLWYQGAWHLPHATTPTSHIIKLPIGKIEHAGIDLSESVENEWLCLKLLSAFGLPVSKAQIMMFDDVKTLVVERFDRQWSEDGKRLLRLPQEDMCQALGCLSALKYESEGGPGIKSIMDLLQGSVYAKTDREQFMKTVYLFWLLGAIDGHAKNFSVLISPQGRYRLAPIYDVLSAYPLAAKRQLEWKSMKMAMAVSGKNRHYHWYNIQKKHWLDTADRCKFPREVMQHITDDVHDSIENVIEIVSNALPKNFPAPMAESVFKTLRDKK